MRRVTGLMVFGVAACLVATATSFARTKGTRKKSWNNHADGFWHDAQNWSPHGLPSATDIVFVKNSKSKTVTIDATTSGSFPGSMTVNTLLISAPRGSINTLLFDAPGTATPFQAWERLAVDEGGAIVVRDASLSVGLCVPEGLLAGLRVAGALTLESGSITVTNSVALREAMVIDAHGIVTVSNGTVVVDSLRICSNANSRGELDVIGGAFNVAAGLATGILIGDSVGSSGTVAVVDGEFIATNTASVVGSIGEGWIKLFDGRVKTARTTVGLTTGSQGSLTIQGGSMEVRGELTLGAAPGARGSIKLTGGELIATNASLIIGSGGGEGVVTVTAPAATAQSRNTSKELRLLAGGGGSVLRARGVTVAAGSQGTLIVDGGTMTVLTDLIVGAVPSATGTVVVGTSLTVGGNFALLNNPRLELNLAGYGQGTDHGFIQVGNTATLAGDLAIRLTSGFANAITNGTSFTVLTARTIVGAFSNAPSGTRVATVDESGDFLVTYDGPSLLLGDFRSSAAP